jgi:DNA-binding XRE family transcriptional regulator
VNREAEAAFLWSLGKRVRLLRLVRELTQDELAGAAGMSRSFLSLIEKGSHGVDVVRRTGPPSEPATRPPALI